MKMKTTITLLVSLFTIGLGTTFATTTDEIEIMSGSTTVVITDFDGITGGTCTGAACADFNNFFGTLYDTNPSDGTITVGTATLSNKPVLFNGWTISGTTGESNSPGLTPYGLDVNELTASCTMATCQALDLLYSDKNFNVPSALSNGFATFLSSTDEGNDKGTVTQTAFISNTNTLFAKTTTIGTVSLSTLGGTDLALGGPAEAGSYSLTIEDAFSGSDGAEFSVDGNVTGPTSTVVPEPAAVFLFGTLLVFFASKLRRRLAS